MTTSMRDAVGNLRNQPVPRDPLLLAQYHQGLWDIIDKLLSMNETLEETIQESLRVTGRYERTHK